MVGRGRVSSYGRLAMPINLSKFAVCFVRRCVSVRLYGSVADRGRACLVSPSNPILSIDLTFAATLTEFNSELVIVNSVAKKRETWPHIVHSVSSPDHKIARWPRNPRFLSK